MDSLPGAHHGPADWTTSRRAWSGGSRGVVAGPECGQQLVAGEYIAIENDNCHPEYTPHEVTVARAELFGNPKKVHYPSVSCSATSASQERQSFRCSEVLWVIRSTLDGFSPSTRTMQHKDRPTATCESSRTPPARRVAARLLHWPFQCPRRCPPSSHAGTRAYSLRTRLGLSD